VAVPGVSVRRVDDRAENQAENQAANRVDDRCARIGATFGDATGRSVHFVRAPGRVNLIGEHTDYQDGFCLPMAIDRDVIVGWRPRTDTTITVRSLELPDAARFAIGADPTQVQPKWARPAAGMSHVLHEHAPLRAGIDAVVGSTIPIGAGLSSSAAFEVAFGLALAAADERELGGDDLALAAQRAEQESTGVPCGVMDQMASVHGRAGHALLLDCRALTITPVAIPDSLCVVVVHCGVRRVLAGTEYGDRRRAVEAAAARLGVATLRDAVPESVSDDPFARHVVSENRRTLMFVAALRRGRVDELGTLMRESHASLRHDFAVSTPELDALVDALLVEGAIGARLTGAGFGGCVVALAATDHADRLADRAAERYRAETGHEPQAFIVRATDGARTIDQADPPAPPTPHLPED